MNIHRRRSTSAKKKPTKRKRINPFAWLFTGIKRIFILGVQFSILSVIAFGGYVYYLSTTIPEFEQIVDGRHNGSVTFLDRNGQVFAWRGDQFDANLRASNASENLVNAVIATEDKRFYRHLGISPRGIIGAMRSNYAANGNPFSGGGGSTITTQVAKLLCTGTEYDPAAGSYADFERDCRRGTVERKLKEMPYAMALELKFTKEEILSIYLNRAYLGASSYGFGAAAKRYFGIPANGLNIQQSAMLAGMLTAPTRYAPTSNLQRSQDRAATVIRLMREQGYITQSEAELAWANPATVSERAQSKEGWFFADWIMSDQPDFLTTKTSEDIVYYTTFDPQIQRDTENAIDRIVSANFSPSSKAEVAVVVMDRTGAVRAMVGGRFDEDVVEQGFNRATQALRQPGSSFKPFVYAAALRNGMRPHQIFNDNEISVRMPKGSPQRWWTPKNYSGRYLGQVTMIKALEQSINTVAVELSENAGRENVRDVAQHLGITTDIPLYPTIALGAVETTLLDMTTAYASILNGTRSVTPYGWTQLGTKRDNAVIMTSEPIYGDPILEPQQAGWLIYMMNNVVNKGTGTNARIDGYQLAGKTGTTNEAKDAWFVGFSGDFVTGVWLGYDDNTPLKGTTGGGFPAEIWRETMKPLLARYGSSPLPMIEPQAPPPPKPKPAAPQPSQDNSVSPNDLIEGLIDLLVN